MSHSEAFFCSTILEAILSTKYANLCISCPNFNAMKCIVFIIYMIEHKFKWNFVGRAINCIVNFQRMVL
jgi:hypothetical protein